MKHAEFQKITPSKQSGNSDKKKNLDDVLAKDLVSPFF